MAMALVWMIHIPVGFVVRLTVVIDMDSYIAVISRNEPTKIFEKPNLTQSLEFYRIRHS